MTGLWHLHSQCLSGLLLILGTARLFVHAGPFPDSMARRLRSLDVMAATVNASEFLPMAIHTRASESRS